MGGVARFAMAAKRRNVVRVTAPNERHCAIGVFPWPGRYVPVASGQQCALIYKPMMATLLVSRVNH